MNFVADCHTLLKMPLAETDADGNITRYYIWSSHGLLAHMDVNPSTGAITATRYYHANAQGSTLALTDEGGTVTDQFAYTPYGGVTRTGTTQTPFQWLGGIAVQNEGNGLYYMLNRYYSADMKRFISIDPKGIDGGSNLYAYGNLNPLFFVDPYGLESTWWNPFSRNFGGMWSWESENRQAESRYAQNAQQYYNSSDYAEYSQSWFHKTAVFLQDMNEAIGTKLAAFSMAYSFYNMPAANPASTWPPNRGFTQSPSGNFAARVISRSVWQHERKVCFSSRNVIWSPIITCRICE